MSVHTQFAICAVMLLVAVGIGSTFVLIPRLLWKRTAARRESHPPEHGGRTGNKSWVQFRVRYAPLALLFVAFDMEMVFMFPWAVAYKKVGMTAFWDMFVFIAILVAAIAFAWKEGGFDWEE